VTVHVYERGGLIVINGKRQQ